MNKINEILTKEWPVNRVIITCNECDGELMDTKKHQPAMWKPSYLTELILVFTRKHEERTSHADIDVGINPEPTPVQEIDCTITVNGK